MKWTERMALGISTIDAQHKQLVELANEAQNLVYDAQTGVDCYDDITTVLKDLTRYTVEHFNFEESLMEKAGYSGFTEHKIEHKNFVKKVSDFMASDIDEDQLKHIEEVTLFLLDWVVKHILDTDSKYVSIVKANS